MEKRSEYYWGVGHFLLYLIMVFIFFLPRFPLGYVVFSALSQVLFSRVLSQLFWGYFSRPGIHWFSRSIRIAVGQVPATIASSVIVVSILTWKDDGAFYHLIKSYPTFFERVWNLFVVNYLLTLVTIVASAILYFALGGGEKLKGWFKLIDAYNVPKEYTSPEKDGPRWEVLADYISHGGVPIAVSITTDYLYKRGNKLREVNVFLLISAMVVIFSTMVFVANAGQITGMEDGGGVAKLKRTVDEKYGQWKSYEASVDKMQGEVDYKVYERMDRQLSLLRQDYKDTLGAYIEIAKDVNRYSEGIGDSVLVAVGVTRLSAMILAVFLLKIIFGLYRYNAELAAHYFSQADSLFLLDVNSKKFGEIQSKMKFNGGFDRGAMKPDIGFLGLMAEKIRYRPVSKARKRS